MSESHEEHNEKQEVDQDSVTTNELREQLNEGLSRSKKQSELIEALIQSQFQPLIFSVETNPLLGPAMRPYIESLREQTRITAFFFARLAGHQEGMADSYWLGAEKYVESLGVWATALAPSVETSFNECSRILREAFPLQKYLHTVWQLAYEMWVNAGRPYFRALDFWASAEKHILTIGGQSIANVNSLSEAVGSLRRTFSDFAADAYLSNIRTRAYYVWKALGEPRGRALDDWLQAESQTLTLDLKR